MTTTVEIKLYHPSMRDQLISMNEIEYPFMKGWFEKRFHALYESEQNKEKARVFVATDGSDKLLACISYVPWPLCFKGQKLNSIQMVGLLVHPDARGKGLFKKILAEMDSHLRTLNPDVILGFPVPESKAGFVKQGWQHTFDLVWYMSPLNILGALKRSEFKGDGFEKGAPSLLTATDPFIQTCSDTTFWKLKVDFFPETPMYHKTYEVSGKKIQIIFRIQKVKGINVAVVGRIYSGNAASSEVRQALKSWKSDLRKSGNVTAVMVAINELCPSGEATAVKKSMFRMNKKITVILKSYSDKAGIMDASNWNIMRGDMETW